VVDPEGGEYPWTQFRMIDGQWAFLDCGYSCNKCGRCIGCARKLVREQDSEGTWHVMDDDPWTRCPDGSDHICSDEELPEEDEED